MVAGANVGFRHPDELDAEIGAEEIGVVEVAGDPGETRVPPPTLPTPSEMPIQKDIADPGVFPIETGRERAAPTVRVGATDDGHVDEPNHLGSIP